MPPRKHHEPPQRYVVQNDANLFDQLAEVDEGGINMFYMGMILFLMIIVIFFKPDAFNHPRWYTALDLNRNGSFTASDMMLWFVWIFSLPGDAFVQLFMLSKPLARFFELSPASFGQPVSIAVSFVYWWLTGGKRLLVFWGIIVLIAVFSNMPSLPLPR